MRYFIRYLRSYCEHKIAKTHTNSALPNRDLRLRAGATGDLDVEAFRCISGEGLRDRKHTLRELRWRCPPHLDIPAISLAPLAIQAVLPPVPIDRSKCPLPRHTHLSRPRETVHARVQKIGFCQIAVRRWR